MKQKWAAFCVVVILVPIIYSAAWAVNLGMITGGKKGTYYQFGLNLRELAASGGMRLSVYNSTGSIENLYAVYKRPRTQLGIVQSDVLAFVARVQTDPVLKRIARKTKMVFPLYNEEIHLLGRSSLVSFDDLAAKRVAIGKEGSGTYLTAKLLFAVAEIVPAETMAIGTDEALAQLRAGSIDAMFYVAGYPVKLFKEDVVAADELALIPIVNKSIVEFYPGAVIPAQTYPWQPDEIRTVAVKAVLVAFNFRRANCEYVGQFAQLLNDNLGWLKANGHPKWQSVDLEYPLRGWEQYDCVTKYLVQQKQRPADASVQINPILEAVKEIMGQ
ncbi:MAG: TAXI family TRAP transporter solute-binding subunit [Desulfosarcinaceae bacterium]|nr:TAXI family TRAP transporter solute-binding subunit [Desulfosarcinaceae bacterium]